MLLKRKQYKLHSDNGAKFGQMAKFIEKNTVIFILYILIYSESLANCVEKSYFISITF